MEARKIIGQKKLLDHLKDTIFGNWSYKKFSSIGISKGNKSAFRIYNLEKDESRAWPLLLASDVIPLWYKNQSFAQEKIWRTLSFTQRGQRMIQRKFIYADPCRREDFKY